MPTNPLDATGLLALPYIMPSQAQKHVTHNEALLALDSIVHLAVGSLAADAPPTAPKDGDRVVVGPNPAGAFSGHAGEVAAWSDGAWRFHAPRAGWRAALLPAGDLHVFDGTAWRPVEAERRERLGINADADATNRLAVSAPATLLTHEGADHRLVVNRAGAGDTASVLFQTDWSGRAEFGLAGGDGFVLKVSADGADWRKALRVDPASGRVTLPASAPAALSLAPRDPSRSYSAGDGLELDAALDPAGLHDPATGDVTIAEAGVYAVGLSLEPASLAGTTGGVEIAGPAGVVLRCAFGAPQVGASVAASDIVALGAGDVLRPLASGPTAPDAFTLGGATRLTLTRLT